MIEVLNKQANGGVMGATKRELSFYVLQKDKPLGMYVSVCIYFNYICI